MMSKCEVSYIEFPKEEFDYKNKIQNYLGIIEMIHHLNKESSIFSDKYDVLMGTVNYIVKIFNEIVENSLENTIVSRLAVRTIIETYVMLKYLILQESSNENVWEEYKLYGISKYKLTMLKVREFGIAEKAHLIQPIIEGIVNEIKWEEFIDVDLKYFDQKGIRDKCIIVDEKELYDIYYEYDTNFSHGLWGAVRESSMLHCNVPSHQYHTVPDLFLNQKLASILFDCDKVVSKAIDLLKDVYEEKLGE